MSRKLNKSKKILLLGSTGSIGRQTLEIIDQFKDQFIITGLAVKNNEELLCKQCQKFKVKTVHIFKEKITKNWKNFRLYQGEEGLEQIVHETDFDILVNALVGEVGIKPTIAATKKGKIVALANKESLVAAGEVIMKKVKKYKGEIRPIDSEHSAIWQSLHAGKKSEIDKIILTCSGGPFRDSQKWPLEKLKTVTPHQALKHPNWNMGKKISIDSATLMNKALEVIEAVRLFQLSPQKIEVVLHPESILHSAVRFCDGSIVGQMGKPDMKTAIAYALFYPQRLPLKGEKFSFFNQKLTFKNIDSSRFPSIDFAFKALKKGEQVCKALNKANEKAVEEFLAKKIGFLDIFKKVKQVLKK